MAETQYRTLAERIEARRKNYRDYLKTNTSVVTSAAVSELEVVLIWMKEEPTYTVTTLHDPQDAMAKRVEALEEQLRVAVGALRRISNANTGTSIVGLLSDIRKVSADALAQIEKLNETDTEK